MHSKEGGGSYGDRSHFKTYCVLGCRSRARGVRFSLMLSDVGWLKVEVCTEFATHSWVRLTNAQKILPNTASDRDAVTLNNFAHLRYVPANGLIYP